MQILTYRGICTELLSKPTNVEENSKIYIENRKESINGQTPAGVTDSLGENADTELGAGLWGTEHYV